MSEAAEVPLRVAIVNQHDEGGATAAARELEAGLRAAGHPTAWHPGPESGDVEALLAALDAFQPDIVHAHCWYQSYPRETLGLLAQRYPTVFTVHDVAVVNQYGTTCWECFRNSHCFGCPDLELLRRYRPNYRMIERWRKRRAFRGLPVHLVLPSKWMGRRLARSEWGQMAATHIPYGIDLEAFSPGPAEREAFGLPAGPIALFAGNMYSAADHRKGVPDLLAAWSRVKAARPGATLAVAGRVPAELLAGRDGVLALGEIPRERLVQLYRSVDLFVLPTRGDNLPVAILEALATGLPVVATAVGGVPEEVGEAAGALVPAGDRAALSSSLSSWLGDAGRRQRAGEAARARAEAHFDRREVLSRHLELFRELIAARKP